MKVRFCSLHERFFSDGRWRKYNMGNRMVYLQGTTEKDLVECQCNICQEVGDTDKYMLNNISKIAGSVC